MITAPAPSVVAAPPVAPPAIVSLSSITDTPAAEKVASLSAPAPAPAGTPEPTPAKTYTQAEYENGLEKVRKEEKDKLYGDLAVERQKNGELAKKIEQLTTENTRLQTTVKSVESSVKDGKIDVSKLVEEVTTRVTANVSAAETSKITKLQTELTEVTSRLRAKELTDARTRLIAAAGGESALIPELVKGNTEEELAASVAESKRIYDSAIARRDGTPITTSTPPAPGNPPAAPAPAAPAAPVPPQLAPAASLEPAPGSPVSRSSTRVAPGDWKAQRESRLQEAAGRYPRSMT